MLDGPGIRLRVSPLLCTRSLGELMQTHELMQTQGKDRITHGLTVHSQHYIWSNSDSSLELHIHVLNCIFKLLIICLTGISHLNVRKKPWFPHL